MTSVAVIVPRIVAGCGGQACVPGGGGAGVVRLEQRKTEMPPLCARPPKWMWAWVTALSRPE